MSRGGRVCGAKKRDGTPCQARPYPNGRCRVHGGATPGGFASANFKHGKFSRFLPKGLKDAYERALRDHELLSLRDEIALLEARGVELLKRIKEAPSLPWDEVINGLDGLAKAKGHEYDQQLLALRESAARGRDATTPREKTWASLQSLFQDKARLVAAESRRLHEMSQFVTKEQALVLFHSVGDAVRENVSDPKVLAAIQSSLARLLGKPSVIEEVVEG